MKRFDAPQSSESSSSAAGVLAGKRRRFQVESSDAAGTDAESNSDTGSSSSSNGSGDSDSSGPKKPGRSELLLAHLSMFPGEEAEADSMAASNGKSKERIKRVLKGPICSCKRKCYKAINFSMVFKLCLTFWSLTKAAQDCVLWGIQNMNSDMHNLDGDDGDNDQSSTSSSEVESGREQDGPTEKKLNCWFIQGRVCQKKTCFQFFLKLHIKNRECFFSTNRPITCFTPSARCPNLSRSVLQTPWCGLMAAGEDPEEFQG